MTTASTITTTPPSTHRIRARALAVLGAVLAALAVWLVAVPLLGAELLVNLGGGGPQVVGPGAIAAMSLLAGLLGWGLLAVLERRTARAHRVWTSIAVIVLLLSLGGPLTTASTPATTAVLALMHLAVGVVLILTLPHGGKVRVGSAS